MEVFFGDVVLLYYEGMIEGEVKYILYKCDRYHLTVLTDWDENIYVDTQDVWDDGDKVGISIMPEHIRVIHL